jgi:hypothetical protein
LLLISSWAGSRKKVWLKASVLQTLSSWKTLIMMTEMEQFHKAVLIKFRSRPNEISTGIQHKNFKPYLKSYHTMI